MILCKEEDKLSLIEDRLVTLENIRKTLEDMRAGVSEAEACRKNNVKKATLRYFIFNENLGHSYTKEDNDVPKLALILSGEERFYVSLTNLSVEVTKNSQIQVPANVNDVVKFLMDGLSERDKSMLHYRYWDCLTLSEIGERLGISRQAVEQRIAKIMKGLYRKNRKIFVLSKPVDKPIVRSILEVSLPDFREDDICIKEADVTTRIWRNFIKYNLGMVHGKTMHISRDLVVVMTRVNLINIPKLGISSVDDFIATVERLSGIKIPDADSRYDNLDLTGVNINK